MIKSSLSPSEYLHQEPNEEDIRVKDGGRYIHNLALEKALDFFDWSTLNFKWDYYKDPSGSLGVAASIELLLPMEDEEGFQYVRSFVGACNFTLASMAPNTHFLATAKSLCMANAASEAGRRLGRGLNEEVFPQGIDVPVMTLKPKMKPDAKIMKKFLAAVEAGDEVVVKMLQNIYDIKTEENGN